ncbi:MAG TPA: hypothetical protein VJ418_04385, partial [Streptosporangiaceae bacterium]|nr:hypothetical protein [Streptosporangiaceae bacterium]
MATGVNGMWPSCGPPPARQRPAAVSADLDERGGVAVTARSVRNRRRRVLGRDAVRAQDRAGRLAGRHHGEQDVLAAD